jgi:hypothetical protein
MNGIPENRLTKQHVNDFLKQYDTPEKAKQLLYDLGMIDETGKLTKQYQSEEDGELQ